MAFLEWLTKRKTPLSKMTRAELRRQELLLEKDRTRLVNKLMKLTTDKQGLFKKGATERSPEVRQIYAQEFEIKTTEQLMLSRQLNVRSKEIMTVSRLRMLRENADRMGNSRGLGLVSEGDLLRLGKLIESDAVKGEIYRERLDEILAIGMEADEESAKLNEAGQTVMDIWNKMDTGVLKDEEEAFDEADRRVRERQAAAEG